jgi:hypothetical protein
MRWAPVLTMTMATTMVATITMMTMKMMQWNTLRIPKAMIPR